MEGEEGDVRAIMDASKRAHRGLIDYASSYLQRLICGQQVLNKANEGTVNQVANFVSDSRSSQLSNIPAGFISAGPNIASHSTLFRQIASELRHSDSNIFVTLGSSECSNLKSLLKALIAKATARGEEDEVLPLNRKGPKLLNFDLQLLHDYVKENSIETVVVAFQDTEAFDGHVLSDAIDLFGIWHARIPFVLLFGIATSTESLQDRLSRSALRCLEGKEFDVVQTDKLLEQVFLSTIDSSERSIWMGPGLVSMLLDRQKDHVQNITEFVDALKVCGTSNHTVTNINNLSMRTCHISLRTSRAYSWPMRPDERVSHLTTTRPCGTFHPSKSESLYTNTQIFFV